MACGSNSRVLPLGYFRAGGMGRPCCICSQQQETTMAKVTGQEVAYNRSRSGRNGGGEVNDSIVKQNANLPLGWIRGVLWTQRKDFLVLRNLCGFPEAWQKETRDPNDADDQHH